MKLLYLDLLPTYVPFLVQCTKADGDKVNPTVDNLIIYEESGVDGSFDATTITGSPFDPVQVNSKTGLWGVLVAKSAFTAGKFYIALWEMTVDGVTTAKQERYFALNASQLKADVSALALDSTVAKSATVAKESAATTNKNAVIAEVDDNEAKIDTLLSRISSAVATALTKLAGVTIAGTETAGSLFRLFYDRVTGAVALNSTVAKDATVAKEATLNTHDTDIKALEPLGTAMRGTNNAALNATVAKEASLSALQTLVTRVLGLTQENTYIDTCVYTSGRLTSARIRNYSKASSVGTDNDVIATYTVTATFTGNEMTSYKVVKV